MVVIAYIMDGVRESISEDVLQYWSDCTGDCLVVVNPQPYFSQLIATRHLKDRVIYSRTIERKKLCMYAQPYFIHNN